MTSERFRFETTPLANPKAIVQGDKFRFTVLTEGLIRLEWAEDNVFEDRATKFAINRALPVPSFKVLDGDDVLEIVTSQLRLVYNRQPFTAEGLSVTNISKASNWRNAWKYGVPLVCFLWALKLLSLFSHENKCKA